MSKQKQEKMNKRRKRVRSKVVGNKDKPRLSVFRSNEHIYTQIINDEKGVTLVSVSDLEVKVNRKSATLKKAEGAEKSNAGGTEKRFENTERMEKAYKVGELIAKKATKKKIKSVVFDRGGYKYHGRVAALADGARKGGLKF